MSEVWTDFAPPHDECNVVKYISATPSCFTSRIFFSCDEHMNKSFESAERVHEKTLNNKVHIFVA